LQYAASNRRSGVQPAPAGRTANLIRAGVRAKIERCRWMMRDVDETNGAVDELPYATHGKESLLGLYNGSSGSIKPGLGFLSDFAKSASGAVKPPPLPENDPGAIGLYIPKHMYIKADPSNPGNDPNGINIDGALAYHSLRQIANRSLYLVRGGCDLSKKNVATLVVNNALLDEEELVTLRTWVEDGGRLLWHGISTKSGFKRCDVPLLSAVNTGNAENDTPVQHAALNNASANAENFVTDDAGALLGAVCTGRVTASNLKVNFADERTPWTLTTAWRTPKSEWPPKPASWPAPPVVARLANASSGGYHRVWKTIGASQTVVAVRNKLGAGSVLGVAAPVTASIVVDVQGSGRDRWHRWFQFAVACVDDEAKCGSGDDDTDAGSDTVEGSASISEGTTHGSGVTSAAARADERGLLVQATTGFKPTSRQGSWPLSLKEDARAKVTSSVPIVSLRVGVYSNNVGGSDSAASAAAVAALELAGHLVTMLVSPVGRRDFVGISAAVVPSQTVVDLRDQLALSQFVHDSSGCVLWHGYYPASFSTRANDMMGAAAVDFRTAAAASFEAFGANWTMRGFPSKWKVRGEVSVRSPQRPTWGTARVAAIDSNGLAALLVNQWGKGTTVTVVAAVESSFLAANATMEFYNQELKQLCRLG
jgi:hypothetical protein